MSSCAIQASLAQWQSNGFVNRRSWFESDNWLHSQSVLPSLTEPDVRARLEFAGRLTALEGIEAELAAT